MPAFSEPLFSIIVAGGSGTRMGSTLAKQFLPLNGKPVLVHTLEKFLSVENNAVILVLPSAEMEYWNTEIIGKEAGRSLVAHQSRITLAEGGKTRFQSVRNGLKAIPASEGLVAIHDGVRPMVTPDIISRSFEAARKFGAVTTAVPLKDSVRVLDEHGGNKATDRSKLRLIQTPQTFDLALIKAAFQAEELDAFTDDASVAEHAGHSVTLIEGDYKNIKITTPEDLAMAEIFLKK